MLGGLHIEMAIISMIGSWLDGSGWTENLVESGITTSGRAESLLKSCHVKRSRYSHEVSYAALNILMHEAYNDSEDKNSESFNQWCNRKQQESVQFRYWLTTMQLEGLFVYIRSIRQGNFQDFLSTLENICPWNVCVTKTRPRELC